jgi:hypothetical protein
MEGKMERKKELKSFESSKKKSFFEKVLEVRFKDCLNISIDFF